MGPSVDEFYDHLKTSSDGGRKLPNWRGELYLEFHRGTYTSHGSIKKGNRKSEILLRDAEHIATLASIYKADKYKYPKEKLDDSWEKVLLNQFHDVLPGSAIGMVYEDAEKLYAEVRRDTEALTEEALCVIYPDSLPLSSVTPSGPLTLFAHNTTPFARRDIVRVPLACTGNVLQTTSDGKEGYVVLEGGPGGGLVLPSQIGAQDLKGVTAQSANSEHFVLRNENVRLTISDGRITSLFDVQLRRELIPQGETGGLVIFEDHPNYWDAWDVEIHHLEKAQRLKFSNVKVVASGPLHASVVTDVEYGKSKITTTISLDSSDQKTPFHDFFNQLTFSAKVDWHERHEFLKFELPLDIHSDVATYETPWGHVQRPTHKNTTWDAAKFEVCGHKFADLSEYGYGVAILSESKYGFSCQGNVLRISLLRAATAPDADQDQGKHEFSWAVLPHRGHFLQSSVPIAAYLFNSPLHVRCVPGGGAVTAAVPARVPFALVGTDEDHSVFLETIKRGDLDSDDGKRTIVLRLYEAYGGHASVVLQVNVPGVVAAYSTNLLEDDDGAEALVLEEPTAEAPLSGGRVVQLAFRGFEVKTVKLVLEKEG
jgi:alpha-mannosidase